MSMIGGGKEATKKKPAGKTETGKPTTSEKPTGKSETGKPATSEKPTGKSDTGKPTDSKQSSNTKTQSTGEAKSNKKTDSMKKPNEKESKNNKSSSGSNNKSKDNDKNVFKIGFMNDRQRQQQDIDNELKGETGLAGSALIQMHEKGELKAFIDKIISQFGIYITIIVMILIAPSMPILFYLTILYNVIIVTWENFKALDVDNIK